MDKETLERVNQPIEYREFPKMLHHPDGRTAIVETAKQEKSMLSDDWCPTPQDALDVRAERDAAEEKRLAAQIAKGKADESKDA